MFEWIVMGLFIGIPLLLMVGALIAWIMQRRQTFTLEDLDANNSNP
jgi:H+/gluconate symporter-like permease